MSTLIFPSNYDDYSASLPHPGSMGSAHSVSGDWPERDVVQRLRDVVEEVTRKPVESAPRKIGFY